MILSIIGILILILIGWFVYKKIVFGIRHVRNCHYCKKTMINTYGKEQGLKVYKFFKKIGKVGNQK